MMDGTLLRTYCSTIIIDYKNKKSISVQWFYENNTFILVPSISKIYITVWGHVTEFLKNYFSTIIKEVLWFFINIIWIIWCPNEEL